MDYAILLKNFELFTKKFKFVAAFTKKIAIQYFLYGLKTFNQSFN